MVGGDWKASCSLVLDQHGHPPEFCSKWLGETAVTWPLPFQFERGRLSLSLTLYLCSGLRPSNSQSTGHEQRDLRTVGTALFLLLNYFFS